MKKIVYGLLIGVSLFGYEMKIEKRFTEEIMPNKLSVLLNISTIQPTLESVMNKLESFNKNMKQYKHIHITTNGFNTTPQYKYIKNKRERVGYRGSINYNIDSDNVKDLEEFIELLSKKESDGVDIYISSRKWDVDEKTKAKAKEKLHVKAVKWSKKYAKTLSKKLDDRCKFKALDLTRSKMPYPHTRTNVSSKELPLDKKSKKEISLDAIIHYECK